MSFKMSSIVFEQRVGVKGLDRKFCVSDFTRGKPTRFSKWQKVQRFFRNVIQCVTIRKVMKFVNVSL